MGKETHLEFKVGLFVFVALIIMTFFIFSVTDSKVLQNGIKVRLVFNFANGLKKSAPVRIAGVDEGIVQEIKLFFDRQDSKTKAEVMVWINKDTKVPADSQIIINQLGLLGEKYVEIFPGVDTKNFFQDGQTIIGKDPIPSEAISERIMQVAGKLEDAVGGFSEMVTDDENQGSIRQALANVSSLTGNLRQISQDVKDGKGTVGRLFYDESMYNDLQSLTADLKANPWKLLYRPK